MSWGLLKSTCRIDTLGLLRSTPGVPKSTPGLPKSTPGLPKSRPGAIQNEKKFEKIDKVCLQGHLGRASVAPVVDFGCHLGALGIHGWAFWIAFGGPRAILDVSFSVFLLKLFFYHIFGCFLWSAGWFSWLFFMLVYCMPCPYSAYDFVTVWLCFMECLLHRGTSGDLRSTQ